MHTWWRGPGEPVACAFADGPGWMRSAYVTRAEAMATLGIRKSRYAGLVAEGVLLATGGLRSQLVSCESIVAYQSYLASRSRTRKPLPQPPEAAIGRLLARADQSGECWLWTGTTNNRGYGTISWNGRATYVHRLAYMAWIGPIPDGMFACHRCDVPACFRPDHLFAGTNLDNMRDCLAKGRNAAVTHPERVARGERAGGAKLTEHDVRALRSRYASGEGVANLAQEYGVSWWCARAAITGRTWAHVAEGTAA